METITIKVGAREREFGVFTTTAPKAYDYGGTIEFPEAHHPEELGRVVIIETSGVEYQRGRNASGLYGLVEAESYVVEAAEGWLWDRIFGRSS